MYEKEMVAMADHQKHHLRAEKPGGVGSILQMATPRVETYR